MDEAISPVTTRRAQVAEILTSCREAAIRREAQAQAHLNEHLRRVERAATRFRVNLRPVLEEYASILSEWGLNVEIGGPVREGEPPRLVLQVVERSGNSHGPPKLLEGSLTFTAAVDLASLSAREETWRLLRGGSRQNGWGGSSKRLWQGGRNPARMTV